MNKARASIIKPAAVKSVASGEVRPLSALLRMPPAPPHDSSKQVTQSTLSQYAPPGFTIPPSAGSERANSRRNTHKHRLTIFGLSPIQSEVIAHLSRQADIAYQLRQLDRVDAIGRQLEELHAPIASYYRGLAAQKFGAGNLDQAERLLEHAVSNAPRNFQARALFILGSVAEYRKDYKAESEFYRAALAANHSDVFTAVEASRAIAIRASIEGDRSRAIQILESLLPLAARSQYLSAQVMNHLAVEYHQAGRLQEAARLAQIVCASPLASIYFEFDQTKEAIRQDAEQNTRRKIIVTVRKLRGVAVVFCLLFLAKRRILSRPRILIYTHVSRSILDRVSDCAPTHAPPFKRK